ncbi:hypothetical protein Pcinc_001854 [Petrolisthes cinctipes]|uniref:Uncharacterized protein n=1 Tax=Petrolisthes cinctipes TaxID=88211 RepID=A0AAE1GMJ1_PETCI|nr:hypothetical protein Pcinc_001854 [Petrolisthes cinctipes]
MRKEEEGRMREGGRGRIGVGRMREGEEGRMRVWREGVEEGEGEACRVPITPSPQRITATVFTSLVLAPPGLIWSASVTSQLIPMRESDQVKAPPLFQKS